jgi:phenylacetate-coenzyme A ligase PaaK-like adenylate-forming protein
MLKLIIAIIRVMRDSKLTVASLEKVREKRLQAVLISAYENVPYYQEVMREVNYNPKTDFKGGEDLSRLPLLTKQIIKNSDKNRIIHQDYIQHLPNLFNDTTSGSTGMPLTIYRAPFERALQIAKWLRVLLKNGYLPTQKVISFSAASRLSEGRSFIQKLGFLRRLALDYNLPSKESLAAIKSYKPQVIYGNRSSFDLLFDEMEKNNSPLSSINFVIMTGECLHEATKRRCKQLFNLEPIETYGSVEMGVMAYGVQGNSGLILNHDLSYFEFLRSDGSPAKAGEIARIVVTDLSGKVQPFIRYEQGDRAIFEDCVNTNGETIRKIVKIIGRDDDVAVLSDGTRIIFLQFYDALYRFTGLNQFRVVQTEFEKFEVFLVTEQAYFDQHQGEIIERLKTFCGKHLSYELKLIDSIPQDPNGKIRFLISKVTKTE